MHFFRRSLYLLYYIKESDFGQLRSFLKYSVAISGRNSISIILDALRSVYRDNVSFKDYFCFRFYNIDDDERREWAGSGLMYEYQRKMNPLKSRNILEDKIKFLTYFKQFVKRNFSTLSDLRAYPSLAEKLLSNSTGFIVLKASWGQIGAEVKVVRCCDFDTSSLINYMKKKNYDLVEEFVVQHPDLMKISPSGLNTVKVITQLNDGYVEILGTRLRITVNSTVDNMAAGNLAAPVDSETGVVYGSGVYSDITKNDVDVHPVTGVRIIGFKVPYWGKVLDMARNAALFTADNRSVGWDIAITSEGPELIEGNHNWCKLLWQMPVRKGLKSMIEKYL